MPDDELRNDLLAKVRQLPDHHLPDLARWLRALECGAGTMYPWSPPLSNTASVQSITPQAVLKSEGKPSHSKDWPTRQSIGWANMARISSTAGTFHKQHYFSGAQRLDYLESNLLRILKEFVGNWRPGPSSRIIIISSHMPCPRSARCEPH